MQLLPTDTPRRSSGPLSTKRGSFTLAAVLALVAAAALLVFLREYKDDLTGSDPAQVFVAKSVIAKGTPGDVIAGQQLYRLEKVEKSALEDGAITDPDDIAGKVVGKEINPGHQLQSSDFESGRTAQAQLSGFQRAMSVPLDASRGLVEDVEAGDRVDVVVTYDNATNGPQAAKVAASNVLVLAMNEGEGGINDDETTATLRVNDNDAAAIAAAVDGGSVWLVLRPAVGARSHR